MINTCSVTQTGEKKSRQFISRARRENPQAVIAVVGCYPQRDAQEVLGIEGVSLVAGTAQRGKHRFSGGAIYPEQADRQRGMRNRARVRRHQRVRRREPHAGLYENTGRVRKFLHLLHHSLYARAKAQPRAFFRCRRGAKAQGSGFFRRSCSRASILLPMARTTAFL